MCHFLFLSKSGMCYEISKSRVSNSIKIHMVVTEFLYTYMQIWQTQPSKQVYFCNFSFWICQKVLKQWWLAHITTSYLQN